jgi:hypothetical protein
MVYTLIPKNHSGSGKYGTFHVKREKPDSVDYIHVKLEQDIYIHESLVENGLFTPEVISFYLKRDWKDTRLLNLLKKLVRNGVIFSLGPDNINWSCKCQQTDVTIYICDYHQCHQGVPVAGRFNAYEDFH